ncbi:uncharacterized protein LOC125658526 [Ostrea edulis]|uniref:uncharacterized protein LOC125658526 n=1 Tax=Ostrea edulis TaxID=37623 RepID=UPI0024AF2D61|nr:uncharacterized protein LOC125658526 [Ostrea edulis]
MKQFTRFNLSRVIGPLTVHSCVQSCMQQHWKYAGLMAGTKCYCGKSYNQTFAVDQKHCDKKCEDNRFLQSCGGAKYMDIYNTDYDVRLLLSIPGNNTNFLEVWNRSTGGTFENMFIDDSLRSPLIDRWNTMTPEYVSVMLFNRYGQPLWSIDFFTNDTNSSRVKHWMTKEWILPNKYYNNTMKNSIFINVNESSGEIKIDVSNGRKKARFAHRYRNHSSNTMTVFSPHEDGQYGLLQEATESRSDQGDETGPKLTKLEMKNHSCDHGNITKKTAVYICCIESHHYNGTYVEMEFWPYEGTKSKIVKVSGKVFIYEHEIEFVLSHDTVTTCTMTSLTEIHIVDFGVQAV